jgi:myosin heavy subunit
VTQNPKERNFHIFYQLCAGMEAESKKQFGMADPDYYNYLNMHACYKVDDTDDANDYVDVMNAMDTMDISSEDQSQVLQIVSGILHIGNIMFREEGSETAIVDNDQREIWVQLNHFRE